ncbi:MAG: S8 family serine peptidase [Micromonosporaceae bacterium]
MKKRALVAAAILAVTVAGVAQAAASTSGKAPTLAKISDSLSSTLAKVSGGDKVTVMVHGTNAAAAREAVSSAGLKAITTWSKIGVVVAKGTEEQIRAARSMAGVTYLEGNQKLEFSMETSHKATRGADARAQLKDADGAAVDGRGVGVAVIDTGIDATHPAFKNADGSSSVKKNLKYICAEAVQPEPGTNDTCFLDATGTDTDTLSVGGHGTHVAGIVGSRDVELTDGGKLHGAAPGAALYGLSVGAGLFVIGADAALYWVLEHHGAPCGEGVPAAECPPIKVTNNSYGPGGGGAFDPNSATVKIQRELAKAGVITVWANGNDGGDGSESLSNPAGMDPTGGIISVASYFDNDNGTRSGVVSEYSSRGKKGVTSTYPDVSAPGENITSACRPYLVVCSTGLAPRNGPGALDLGTFNTISGTSMAAPHIAGIVAQMYQVAPNASAATIEDALKSTAHKYTDGAAYETVGNYTSSYDKGTGLVDVYAAARKLGATAA